MMKPALLENLIVLTYSTSKHLGAVVDVCTATLDLKDAMEYKNENIKIDFDNNRWSYTYWKNLHIGEPRPLCDSEGIRIRFGIIGVYDKTNEKHLKSIEENSKYFMIQEHQADD